MMAGRHISMDISKLPRMSETGKHAPQPSAQPPPGDQPQREPERAEPGVAYERTGPGPEIWFSIAIGVILLLMYPRFLQWVSSKLFGTHFNPFLLPDGSVIPYTRVPEFWGDLGPTLFGVVLIVEGIALACSRTRAVMWAAFALTVCATAYNFGYLVVSYSRYGLAIISALAVVFGVYIAMYQWKLLQRSAWRA
jgi:hypothetical protein